MNANQLQSLQDSSLVRFRGMIQDMYDPEYYYQSYSVIHKQSNVRTVKNGKYLDTAFCEVSDCAELTIQYLKKRIYFCFSLMKTLKQKAHIMF